MIFRKISQVSCSLVITGVVLFQLFGLFTPQIVFAGPTTTPNTPATPATSGQGLGVSPNTPNSYTPIPGAPDYSKSGVQASISKYLCVPNLSNTTKTGFNIKSLIKTAHAQNIRGGSFSDDSDLGDDTENEAPPSTVDVGPVTSTAISSPSGNDLVQCVNKLYRFAAVIGSFAAVFFIALAGYHYILGGESSKEKAKTLVSSVVAGLVIIFASFLLLKFINPDLIKFKTIQPPQFGPIADLPPCSDPRIGLGDKCALPSASGTVAGVGNGQGGGTSTGKTGEANGCRVCKTGTGSAADLQNTCMGPNADVASYVAAAESSCGANPISGSDICADGNVVSFGLFQINISAHDLPGLKCISAFSGGAYTKGNHNCRVIDATLYNKCKAAALDYQTNVNYACKILSGKKSKVNAHWYPTWGGASCLNKSGADIVK